MANQKLQKNPLEWVVFGLSCLVVCGVLGYLIYSSVTLGNSPPNIKVELGKPQKEDKHFRVPVKVRNDGDQTAEGVLIEVELQPKGKEKETAEFESAFLPRHSEREGAVLFKSDPSQGELSARVLGYEKP